MSQLMPFVRAFRALGASCEEQAHIAESEADKGLNNMPSAIVSLEQAGLLFRLAGVFAVAATRLEQQIAKDLDRPHG